MRGGRRERERYLGKREIESGGERDSEGERLIGKARQLKNIVTGLPGKTKTSSVGGWARVGG